MEMREQRINYIEKDSMLTISLGHISKEAADFLDREAKTRHMGVEVYIKEQNPKLMRGEGIYTLIMGISSI